jgi:hypothetical protein
MQVKKLSALCALALASLAGSAHAALTAAQQAVLNDANANGRIVFISGASAVQKGFAGGVATLFSGTPFYLAGDNSKNIDANDHFAVAGTLAVDAGGWPAGANVVVIERTKGGSVWGVNPVARAESIEALDVAAANCGSAGSGTAAAPFKCSLTNRVPDAGVSDVAPALFKAPVNTEGEVAADELSAAELASLAVRPIYGLAFGVPVTSTVGANVKFTRSIVSAIMAGNVGTWDQVDASESGDVVICRRVPGSGTQAVMNLWAGNYPCSGEANIPADRDTSGNYDPTNFTEGAKNYTGKYVVNAGTGGVVVVENSTSGQVRDCLNKAVTGGSYDTSDRDGKLVKVTFNGAGHKAIGVLSMDSLPSATAAGNWQFRSLDGAGKMTTDLQVGGTPVVDGSSLTGTGKFPTKTVYENGDWDLQGWVSFNVPSRTTGSKLALLDSFAASVSSPALLESVSSLKNVAMAIPGQEAPFEFTGPQVLDAAYLGNNQCAPYNRNYND